MKEKLSLKPERGIARGSSRGERNGRLSDMGLPAMGPAGGPISENEPCRSDVRRLAKVDANWPPTNDALRGPAGGR